MRYPQHLQIVGKYYNKCCNELHFIDLNKIW